MEYDEYDIERLKEGIRIGTKTLGDLMRQSQKRRDVLISILVPLLEEDTKHKIIESNKWRSMVEECSDEKLLRQHLGELIMDFDCNIHYLKEDEILSLAEVINRKPFISFFINDD